MKVAINAVLLFLFGSILGWFGQQHFKLEPAQGTSVTLPILASQPTSAPILKSNKSHDELTVSSEQIALIKKSDNDWLKNIDVNSKLRKPELNSAKRILEYLSYAHEQQADYYALRERGLRDYLRENPQLTRDLLDQLINIENDKVRSSLGSMLEILNMQQQPLLELQIMEHIKAGEDTSAWLKVLGNWGLQSKSNLTYLYKQLGNFPVVHDQANIVRAISESSWVKNSALRPDDRSALQSLIKPHFESEEVSLRTAAFASLRTLPVADTTTTLLAGLRDSAPQVRREALAYIMQRKPSDEVLNRQMMNMANDPNLGLVERSSFAHILSQASNTQVSQRVHANKLLEDITAKIKALPEDERRALYYRESSY